MSNSWDQVQQLLENPYVSADTKEKLLAAYADAFLGRGMAVEQLEPPEAREYLEQYDLFGDAYTNPFLSPLDALRDTYERTSVEEVIQKAKAEAEANGSRAQQRQNQLETNQEELDSLQRPAPSGGVRTSDELFERARPALSVFEIFIPVDDKIPYDCHSIHGPLDFDRDIRRRFDEQSGIDFRTFLAEAERLRAAYKSLSELKQTGQSRLNAIYKDWTGPAANSSYDHYINDIEPATMELLDQLGNAPRVIESAVEAVYTACKDKAEQVIKLYSATMGGAPPDIAAQIVEIANGKFDSKEELLKVAAWMDIQVGSHLETMIRWDWCKLDQETRETAIRECRQWIRGSFNPDFYGDSGRPGTYLAFEQICDDTLELVNEAWKQLNSYMEKYQAAFPGISGSRTDFATAPPTYSSDRGDDQSPSDREDTPGDRWARQPEISYENRLDEVEDGGSDTAPVQSTDGENRTPSTTSTDPGSPRADEAPPKGTPGSERANTDAVPTPPSRETVTSEDIEYDPDIDTPDLRPTGGRGGDDLFPQEGTSSVPTATGGAEGSRDPSIPNREVDVPPVGSDVTGGAGTSGAQPQARHSTPELSAGGRLKIDPETGRIYSADAGSLSGEAGPEEGARPWDTRETSAGFTMPSFDYGAGDGLPETDDGLLSRGGPDGPLPHSEEELDKLTVSRGDNQISITEPDDTGEMSIVIDDGSGPPEEYTLDFTSGVGPVSGPVAGPETGVAEMAADAADAFRGSGEGMGGPASGPLAENNGAPSDEDDQHVYQPGPDGEIHIVDGDLEITARQPQGLAGPTVVTINDGTGEPVTYTLGEVSDNEAAGPGAGQLGTAGNAVEDSVSASLPRENGLSTGSSDERAAGELADAPAEAADTAGSWQGAAPDAGPVGTPGAMPAGEVQDAVSDSSSPDGGARSATAVPDGSAALGAAPNGSASAGGVPTGRPATDGSGGGVPRMAGMGMMGAGMAAANSGGGDEERGGNQYQVTGSIFADSGSEQHISGSLHDDVLDAGEEDA